MDNKSYAIKLITTMAVIKLITLAKYVWLMSTRNVVAVAIVLLKTCQKIWMPCVKCQNKPLGEKKQNKKVGRLHYF